MDDCLEIRTLGGLTILHNDTPIGDFDQRKVPALLVYLAFAERPQPREVLAELFWEDRTQSQSLANLRVALSNLRKTVGPFVDIDRDTVGMNASANWRVDAHTFHAHVESADNGQRHLEEAIALYGGDFLDGFFIDSQGFEDWALLERERLRFLAMQAFDELISHAVSQGAYDRGIEHSTRLLRLDPLREKTHRQLMQLQALAGERKAALAQYETCRQMLQAEMGVEPTRDTHDLYERIMAGSIEPRTSETGVPDTPAAPVGSSVRRPRHNLPVQSTSFVGREDDISAIVEQLGNPDCRLLTLVGPGGIGKTRLALAVSEHLVDDFTDGAFFVPLAPLTSPDGIVSAIATAVQFQFYQSPDSAEQQLLGFFRAKNLLLFLDNFEHLLDGVGIVDAILSTAPGVTVLTTSREPLNLGWEWLYEVRGLACPDSKRVDCVETFSAVRLFVERARRVQPGFRLADERDHVVRICQLVEGMPLGIEIAAAWVRTLPCEAIAAELLDLESPQRDVSGRHRSLRTVFDYTWQHLSAQERDTFMKLSAFRGGLTREAAEIVAEATVPRLAVLVNKSLLHCDRASRRYSIHELLRQFADEQLELSGESLHCRSLHYQYYMTLLHETGKELRSENFPNALAVIRADFDNIRLAWHQAAQNVDVRAFARTMEDLRLYVSMSGLWLDGATMFGQAANALESNAQSGIENDVVLGELLAREGWCYAFGGLPERTARLAEQVRALIKRLGVRPDMPFALWAMWPVTDERATYQERLDVQQTSGNSWGVGAALLELAHYARHEGELDQAGHLYRQSLEILLECGDYAMAFWPRLYLYRIKSLQGKSAEAEVFVNQCFEMAERFNSPFQKSVILVEMMMDAFFRDDLEEAERLAHEGYELAQDVGASVWACFCIYGLGRIYYSHQDYAKAVQMHEKGLSLANRDASVQLPFFWQLGFARTRQREFQLARAQFAHALRLAQELPVKWPNAVAEWVVDILAGIACLQASEGDFHAALRCLSVSVNHTTMWKYKQDEARLRADLEAEFGPDAVAEAIERGRDIDPIELAREVLAELEQSAS